MQYCVGKSVRKGHFGGLHRGRKSHQKNPHQCKLQSSRVIYPETERRPLVFRGMFLLSIAAPAWKNIQKLGACDEQGGSAPEKEAEERRPYLFMDMYRRVVRHRFPV